MHTFNFVSLKRCAQPYKSSLRATVANQHHRWARAAIEEPDVAKTMYENTSSILILFCHSAGKCKITCQPQYLPEDNIHQITRPTKVARLAHSARIATHQHQVYLPRMSRSISLRPSSSPTVSISRLTA